MEEELEGVELLQHLIKKLERVKKDRYGVMNADSEERFYEIQKEFLDAGFPFNFELEDYLDETEDSSSSYDDDYIEDKSSK